MELNNYYVEDNINILKKIETNKIQLIYFDPPYNTGRNFNDFDDKFENIYDYCNFLQPRIEECRRVLKEDGTIVIHAEPKIIHYIRVLCDKIFGLKNFRNEIIWQTGGNSKNKIKLNRYHDNLIVYSKSKKQKFNPIYFNYDEEYKKKSNVKKCNLTNKEYVTTAAFNSQPNVNPRLNLRYEWNGHEKQWYLSKEKMKEFHNNNKLEYNKNGIPRIKRFLDEMKGIPLRDIWCDITNTQNGEKLDYATQKPIKLLERIISLYSDKNDLCLDIFAGSGTLGKACKNLERDYILIDINEKGKNIFKNRIIV